MWFAFAAVGVCVVDVDVDDDVPGRERPSLVGLPFAFAFELACSWSVCELEYDRSFEEGELEPKPESKFELEFTASGRL